MASSKFDHKRAVEYKRNILIPFQRLKEILNLQNSNQEIIIYRFFFSAIFSS